MSLVSWTPIISQNYWATYLVSAKISNITVPLSVNAVIYDSGTSLIYMPTQEYNVIRAEIIRNKKCYKDSSGDTYCKCKDEHDPGYPTIQIDIGNMKLTLESKWYLMKFTYSGANPDCFVGISADDTLSGNYWLLGDTFLRAYLMFYDKGNN
jgi:cathepsin D